MNDLARRISDLKPFGLAAATDGNHGWAVASMAATVGYFRSRPWEGALIGVEPADANFVQVSAQPGPGSSRARPERPPRELLRPFMTTPRWWSS
jgi:hypothetical protein